MSLILEALKKSEAKRRLGSAPDLGTPFASRRKRSPIVPIVVAILIVGALAWWWMQRTPSTPPQSDVVQVAPPPRAGAPLKSVTGNNNLQPTPPPSNLVKAPPPPAAKDPFVPAMDNDANAARQAMKEQRERRRGNLRDRGDNAGPNGPMAQGMPPNIPAGAQIPNRSNNAAPAPAPAVAANAPRPAAPITAAPPIAAKPTPPPAVAAVPPAPTQQATAQTQKTADAAQPAADVAARAPKTPGTVGLPATPSSAEQSAPSKPAPSMSAQPYSELPFSFRKSLPELRLSMHVYMAEPAQRFVILNDSRIGEGDKTNDDVYVREIRPDGAVLEFQGQRFFYPRDGL
jgi:general secretion pathway protein B